jgi:3-oxoacyl-[acyl-carrier protein] reductase
VLVHGFEPGQAEPVASEIRDAGGRADAIAGDIRTDEGSAEVASAALGTAERIDILVNNYGVAEGGAWFRSSSDDWIDQYQKNVLSAVRLSEAFVPGMREASWGRVLFLSTIGATRPAARMPHYYSAKAALLAASVSLAQSLAGTGITVNTVSPGLIDTEEVRQMMGKVAERAGEGGDWPEIERFATKEIAPNPTGRTARRSEVAALVAFLAGDVAGYINGQNIRIDGGAIGIVS